MLVELHMLQNFPPSCLNRDDTNAPKDCEFGGCRRARISSQCLKRAVRTHPVFAETVGDEIGIRTKRLIEYISGTLREAGKPEDAAVAAATAIMGELGGKIANGRTAVALYLGPHEIERVAEEINTNWDALAADGTIDAKQATAIGKTLIKEFSDVASAADIALFGRMVAGSPDLNIDASCQVAHAISTHRAQMEMDFFTAVDNLQPDSEPGAGMMGTIEFNSSCFYRYSLLDCDQLTEHLDSNPDLAARTVNAFIRASVAAIPSARQNSMAAQNPPSFVMAVVRESGTPWSLADAFQRPVYISLRDQQGLVEKSLDALDDYWGRLAPCTAPAASFRPHAAGSMTLTRQT